MQTVSVTDIHAQTHTPAHITNNTYDITQKQQGDNHDHLALPLAAASLGIRQQQGSGWSSKPKWKITKQNVHWRTRHSGNFLSITIWKTIISCVCVWEIINFRKTKYVRFIPGASNYFCVFKTESVECNDILKAICYLLISSHAFYLSCGLKGEL